MNEISVALIPDRFASYRYPLFRALSDIRGCSLRIYADTVEDVKGLKLVDPKFCDLDKSNGGLEWQSVKNITFKKLCIWQVGLISKVLSSNHDVYVFWGEANRASTWICALLARMKGAKVVFWSHGLYGNEGFLKHHVRTSFYKLADSMLLYGSYAKGLLMDEGFYGDDLYVVNNSLDCIEKNRLFKERGFEVPSVKSTYFKTNDRVLLFLGRLESKKKLSMLIRAVRNLKSQGPYKLLLVGDGGDRENLENLVSSMNLKNDVFFYGACYEEEELAPLVMMSHVCVAPGEVGLTAMHSLVYGTPVITHNKFSEQMPEFEVIKEGESGGYFEHDDQKNMETVISDVCNKVDSGEIDSESCRGGVMLNYTVDYQVEVFESMLVKLTS